MKSSLLRATALVVLVPALFLPSACRTQTPRPEAPPMASLSHDTPDPLPRWAELPAGEERLHQIELWQVEQDPSLRGYWQIEAELQLGTGRLDEARRTLSADKTRSKDAALATRVRNARGSLEKVAKDPAADESQQKRANDALGRADKLLADLGQGKLLLGVPVIARSSWGALPAKPALMIKNSGGWKKITVHHSAEAEPAPLDGSAESSAAALRQIQRSHLKSKMPPWGDIGYHFLVDPEGRVFQGRDLAWQGAHAKGDNNIQNIGICLLGNFDEEKPTSAALESLRKLLDNLRRTYNIPRSEVHKHADFRSTDCPGKFLKPWVEAYQRGGNSAPSSLPVNATAKRK